MTAHEVFDAVKHFLDRPTQYLVLAGDGQGPEDNERVFAVVVETAENSAVIGVAGVFPVEDDFYSTRAFFRLAAWCDRQGEFMEYGDTISGKEE